MEHSRTAFHYNVWRRALPLSSTLSLFSLSSSATFPDGRRRRNAAAPLSLVGAHMIHLSASVVESGPHTVRQRSALFLIAGRSLLQVLPSSLSSHDNNPCHIRSSVSRP